MKWQCTECTWISAQQELLTAPNPFDPAQELCGCPKCKEVNCFRAICDEPGCTREVSCGWPTPSGGYRQTCSKHHVVEGAP